MLNCNTTSFDFEGLSTEIIEGLETDNVLQHAAELAGI